MIGTRSPSFRLTLLQEVGQPPIENDATSVGGSRGDKCCLMSFATQQERKK